MGHIWNDDRHVECALCGSRRRNDRSVTWLGRTWKDRHPYCAEDCARDMQRSLARVDDASMMTRLDGSVGVRLTGYGRW